MTRVGVGSLDWSVDRDEVDTYPLRKSFEVEDDDMLEEVWFVMKQDGANVPTIDASREIDVSVRYSEPATDSRGGAAR